MPAARASDSGERAREHADRPDAGEELEAVAKIEVRRHLGAVRIAHVGQPIAPSRMASAVSAPCSAAGGSASPVRRVELGAGLEEGEVEREAADPLDDRLEQRDAWLHDLAADAVAREDCYVKLAHTHP